MPTSACWATPWPAIATLFAREDYVEEAWRIVDPVLKAATPVYRLRAGHVGTAGSATAIAVPHGGWDDPTLDRTPAPWNVDDAAPTPMPSALRAAPQFIATEARAAVGVARALHVRGERRAHAVADAARACPRGRAVGKRASLPGRRARGARRRPRPQPDAHSRTPARARRRCSAANQLHAMPVEAADLAAAAPALRARARARSPARRRCSISCTWAWDPTGTPRRWCPATRCLRVTDRRCRAHRRLPGTPPHDADLSRSSIARARPVRRHRRGKGADARAAARAAIARFPPGASPATGRLILGRRARRRRGRRTTTETMMALPARPGSRHPLHQHDPHAVDRRRAGRQFGSSGRADGAGAARVHAVEPRDALRPAGSDLAQPRPLRAVATATRRCCCGRCCTSPACGPSTPNTRRSAQPAVTLDDIRHFRQLGSKAPGHPEYHLVSGVETTTGPLGQGIATSVGMAIAQSAGWRRATTSPASDLRLRHLRACAATAA